MMSTAGGKLRELESKVGLGALAVTLFGGLATVALGSVSLDAIAQVATLRAPSEFSNIEDERVRSQALFTEPAKVLLDRRCLNCHPEDRQPTQGNDLHPHMPPMHAATSGRGERGLACESCHQKTNTTTSAKAVASVPGGGNPHWALPPASMSWQGKTLGEICEQLKDRKRNGDHDLEGIHHHVATDTLVAWAWNPGLGRRPAPGSQKEFAGLSGASESVARWRSPPVRLLPIRANHVRVRTFESESEAKRFRYRQSDVRKRLPLRYLRADSRGHQGGGAQPCWEQVAMRISRREFLQTSGALCIAFNLSEAKGASPTSTLAPNAFVRIDSSGQVTVIVPYVEMGQGTYTSIPMLIAEELEVALASVRVEHAPASNELYGNPLLGGFQATGNSNAIRGAWIPMRQAGAVARTMLVSAAAEKWGVGAASCRARNGEVIHTPSGRRLEYCGLLESAAKMAMPKPESGALKPPTEFKPIGTPRKRLDLSGKVNGKALYGIDVMIRGMKFAALAISPVLGGKPRSVDESEAKAVPGVRQIVQLSDSVGVVADNTWAAKKGVAALKVEWDEGPNASVSSASILALMQAASEQPGAIARKEGDFKSAFDSAATRFQATYEMPFLAHATMEPMNCTVHVRRDGCDIWTGTQAMTLVQMTAAKIAGLPVDKVVVHNHLIGGGFGRRLQADGVARAVELASQGDAPVQVSYSRDNDIQHDMYRPYWYDRVSAGLDAQGKPVALQHRLTGSSIMARWAPPL